MVEGWYWKNVCVRHCCRVCEYLSANILWNHLFPLQLVPFTPFRVEMKAKLQKTTQMLTYSHIYKGPVLEKEWNRELNTPTLGGNQHRC